MKIIRQRRGFTFVEVLVSLVILSVGIVAIFQSYLKSLDYMSHLTNRMMVTVLLDDSIDTIQRELLVYNILPYDIPENKTVNLGFKNLEILRELKISEVDEFVDIFRLDLSLSWKEGGRAIKLTRSAYLSDFDFGGP